MSETVATRSPSETLMTCLEEFGKAEPTRVMVIWTDETGDLCWSTSSPRLLSQMIGILECAKAALTREFLELE